MRGIIINFEGSAPVFDFSDTVKDFDATVQNAMVNLGTSLGSDVLYPDKGTYLLLDAVQGRMVNLQWANNSANFAALKTMVFSRNTDVPSNTFGLQTLTLTANTFNIQQLQLSVGAVSDDGTTVGTAATL